MLVGGSSGGGVFVFFTLLQYQTIVMGGMHNFSPPLHFDTTTLPQAVSFSFFFL